MDNKQIEEAMQDVRFGENLFNLLAKVLNTSANREVLETIRGEYGLLWYLLSTGKPMTVGELAEKMKVVPGRMTDILKNLEKKGLIERSKSKEDKRIVVVSLLEEGKKEAIGRREYIREKFDGIDKFFDPDEQKELIRLLNMLLTFTEEKKML